MLAAGSKGPPGQEKEKGTQRHASKKKKDFPGGVFDRRKNILIKPDQSVPREKEAQPKGHQCPLHLGDGGGRKKEEDLLRRKKEKWEYAALLLGGNLYRRKGTG